MPCRSQAGCRLGISRPPLPRAAPIQKARLAPAIEAVVPGPIAIKKLTISRQVRNAARAAFFELQLIIEPIDTIGQAVQHQPGRAARFRLDNLSPHALPLARRRASSRGSSTSRVIAERANSTSSASARRARKGMAEVFTLTLNLRVTRWDHGCPSCARRPALACADAASAHGARRRTSHQ